MTPEEKIKRVAALRKEIADGRRKREASASSDGDGTNTDQQARSGVSDVFRQSDGTRNDYIGPEGGGGYTSHSERQPGSDGRNAQTAPFGSGRAGRRPGRNFSSDANLSEGARSAGRLVADEPIPTRRIDSTSGKEQERVQDKSGRWYWRYIKEKIAGNATPLQERSQQGQVQEAPENRSHGTWKRYGLGGKVRFPWSGAKVLSKEEVNYYKETYVDTLADDFDDIDKWLRWRTGDPNLEIWSDLDTAEITKLASLALKGGQKSPFLATVVRESSNLTDYMNAGIILVPRIQKTLSAIRASRGRRKSMRAMRMQGVTA